MEHDGQFQLRKALRRAIGDARTLGWTFVLLGSCGCWVAWHFVGRYDGRVLASACGTLLLGPGVMYLVAAQQLGQRLASGARLGRLAASIHLAALPVILGLCLILGWNRAAREIIVPAMVSIFFIPALAAFLFSMTKAVGIARRLEDANRAFEVMPAVVVLPIDGPIVTPSPNDHGPPIVRSAFDPSRGDDAQ